MVRYIVRDAALPFTWLLLHTPITANQVTVVSITVVSVAPWFFAKGEANTFLIGSMLLQFWYLIDHIDGQIARYRKQESITGVFLDFISHYFPHLLIFPFISIGLFRNEQDLIYMYMGILTGAFLTLINLIFDCKYKSFFWGVSKYGYTRINIECGEEKIVKAKGIARVLFSWLYKGCEIHVIINILLFLSIFLSTTCLDFEGSIKVLLISYALLSAFVFVLKLSYYVIGKRIDADFFNTFRK